MKMMRQNVLGVNEHTAVLPQSVLNAYGIVDCGAEFKPGDTVLHTPGRAAVEYARNHNLIMY